MYNSLKIVLMFCIIASVFSICVRCAFWLFTNLWIKLSHKKNYLPDENDYIRKYLDSYVRKDKPGYAVFIQGLWGSGKTFFIKNYKTKAKNKALCYISLFGVSNKSEFEFRLWKGMIFDTPHVIIKRFCFLFISSLIVFLLCCFYGCTTFHSIIVKYSNLTSICLIFYDNFFASPIFTSALGIFSIITAILLFVWKFTRFKTMELLLRNRFLVLDDFERVEASCDEVLSWVNEFVEHINCPVIMIGNEKAIFDNLKLKHNDQANGFIENYKTTKEKTIGKEFSFSQTDEKVCRKLISNLNQSSPLRKTLENNIEWFVSVLLAPLWKEPYKHQTNYRVLALCFAEFEYYFNEKSIDSLNDWKTFVADEKLWKELIVRFLSFMYLKKINVISIAQMGDSSSSENGKSPSIQDLKYTNALADNIFKCDLLSDDKNVAIFRELYPIWNGLSSFLPISLWLDIKDSKIISKDVFSKFISELIHPESSIFSLWNKMYYLDDLEYQKLLEKTENEFNTPSVQSLEELITFLKNICIAFEKNNTKWTQSQLEDKFDKYISIVLENGNIQNSLINDSQYHKQIFIVQSISSSDMNPNSIFNNIRKKLFDGMKAIHMKASQLLFNYIIKQIENNPTSFDDWYYKENRIYIDCFSLHNPNELWNVLFNLSTNDFRTILECLRGHIDNIPNGEMKNTEIKFWEDIVRLSEKDKEIWKKDNINIWKCDYINVFTELVRESLYNYKKINESRKKDKQGINSTQQQGGQP